MKASRYYFALPRLLARGRGRSSTPTGQDWTEANVVGTAMHLIVYLFFAQLLTAGRPIWQQALLLVALLLFLGFGWMIYFYFSSRLLHLLRTMHLLGKLPDDRAESLLISAVISGLAVSFVLQGSWLAVIGWIWLAAVAGNLLAATLLALRRQTTAP